LTHWTLVPLLLEQKEDGFDSVMVGFWRRRYRSYRRAATVEAAARGVGVPSVFMLKT
jgi:hypothetical protein